jgi:trimeric autotransporter adhesin
MKRQEFTPLLLVAISACLLLPGISSAQYNINLAAGGGPNGLPALSSSVGNPGAIARDALGNTYLSDAFSNRIFKISTGGTVSVFAGNGFGVNGEGDYAGDGGPATSAELNSPEGLAVDASGDVYIADTSNSRIRCVVAVASGCLGSTLPVGSITTVAGSGASCQPTGGACGDGGPASAAQLSGPTGIFVDSLGNLYIADTDDSKIRCIVVTAGGCFSSGLAVGSITTVAGNGTNGYTGDGAAATSAELNLPQGLYVDGPGNIYIADTANSVIREVVAATGNIQTIAGVQYSFQAACNFSGDNGPATSADLCLPQGVYLDNLGNLYIADTENSAVREVSAGTIQTIAGTGGSSGYTGNGGAATSALLNLPSGLYLDGSNNVFIADTGNYVVREVSGGTIQAYAGNHRLAYSGDGSAATNASLNALGGTAVDAQGNLFIADTYNHVIREIVKASGNIVTVAGNGDPCDGTPATCGDGSLATSAELNVPQGVFVDSLGDTFIADTGDFAVRCVIGASGGCLGSALPVGSITTVAGTGTQCVPTGSACGDGSAATSADLGEVFGAYVDSTGANNTPGNLFIADTGDAKVRCVVGVASGCFGSTLAVGSITTVAGTGSECQPAGSTCGDGGAATSAQLKSPASVFADSLGNLFIADTLDSKIRCVVTSPGGCFGSSLAAGNITTVAGGTTPGYSGDGGAASDALLNEPYGIFVDALGNLFIADSANSALREVVAVTGNIQTLAGNGMAGYSGDPGPASNAQLAEPLDVSGDSSGDIFVSDTDNSRVRELVSTVNVTAVPTSATLPTGGPQQFAATVTGASNTFVTWEVNGIIGGNATVGTVSSLGSYQAPSGIPASPSVTITAVANTNGFNLATATVTIVDGTSTPTVTISTSPTATAVYTGTTQLFSANVTDSTNTAVNWEVNGVAGGNATLGTIGTDGTYTAPAGVPTPATVVITAISQANANISGTYPIVIVAAPTAPAPASQTTSSGGAATYDMVLDGKSGYSHQAMTLSCLQSSLPQGATCTFQPAKIVAATSGVAFALTVNLPACSASLVQPAEKGHAAALAGSQLFAAFLPLSSLFFAAWRKDKKFRRHFLVILLVCAPLAGLLGCGGGGGSSGGGSCPNLAGTYHIVVQGTIPGQPAPITITTVTLTVQ